MIQIKISDSEFSKYAEAYVLKLEVKRAKSKGLKPPVMINQVNNNGKVHCGYDIESEDRHIEVKSFIKQKTYKDLTAKQTEVMKNDPLYFVYLVEYNVDESTKPIVLPIPQKDLFAMATLKEYIRLNGISNKEKRIGWKKLLK